MNFPEIANKKNSIHNGMTFGEVVAALGRMLDIEPRQDLNLRQELAVDYEPAWAIGARIAISRESDPASWSYDEEFYRLRIEVSFSSSHFTPAEARARAILIGHVADMACFAEACVSNLRWARDDHPLRYDSKTSKWTRKS